MEPQREPTIREADASDRGDLVEMRLLLQRHLEASNPRIWRMTEEGERKIAEEVEQMLCGEDSRVVVAEVGGVVVGYAYGTVSRRASFMPRSVGFINGIYVREPYRRRGIGIRLMEELCKFFDAEKVDEVNLRYVLGNREGEGFWRRLGFKPIIHTANIPLEELERRL